MAADTWRERDLAGTRGPVPASVGAVVHRTWVGLRAALVAESVLLGAGAWTASLAALSVSGAAVDRWDAWCAALVAGGLTACTWFLERRITPTQVARRLDRRLRHQGALITAFEVERRGVSGTALAAAPMRRLLARRVLARLRTREALSALKPAVALPVAAPLLGAGLLALALEGRRAGAELPADLGGAGRGMAGAVEALADRALEQGEAGALEPGAMGAVLDLAQRARDVAHALQRLPLRPERGGAPASAGSRAELEAFERELERLDAELARLRAQPGATPELEGAIDGARNWLDATRLELEGARGAQAETGGAPDGAAAPAVAGSAGETGQELAPAPEPEPDSVGATPGVVDPERGARPERGTLSASAWPEAYRRIVARWLEHLDGSRARTAPPDPAATDEP